MSFICCRILITAWFVAVLVAKESNGNKKYPLEVSFSNKFPNSSLPANLKFTNAAIFS